MTADTRSIADPLSPLTRRYFETLPNSGSLEAGQALHVGEAGSREEGTWVRFCLSGPGRPGASGALGDVRFRAYGCPHVLAAASWLAQVTETRGEPPEGGPRDWLARFDAPPEKLGRFLILEDALHSALRSAAEAARSA